MGLERDAYTGELERIIPLVVLPQNRLVSDTERQKYHSGAHPFLVQAMFRKEHSPKALSDLISRLWRSVAQTSVFVQC